MRALCELVEWGELDATEGGRRGWKQIEDIALNESQKEKTYPFNTHTSSFPNAQDHSYCVRSLILLLLSPLSRLDG